MGMQSWKKGIVIGLFSSLMWEQSAVEASTGVKGMDVKAYADFVAATAPVTVPYANYTANDGGAGVAVAARPVKQVQWEKYIPKQSGDAEEVRSQHRLLAERKQLVSAQQEQASRQKAREQAVTSTQLASRGEITTTYVSRASPSPQQTSQQASQQITGTSVTTNASASAVSNSAPTLIKSSGTSSTLGNRAVTIALQYEGVPYRYGGTTPSGFDCSGFIQYVMKQAGIDLPRTTYQQISAGTPVSQANLRPGDIVFFSCGGQATSHSGMYVGNGKFIHADLNRGVTVADLNSSYWAGVYQAAVRVN
jgi:peptidoglycan DL-endopeptidase CwlO